MSSPYTPVVVVDYNISPPEDDGSQISTNQVKWKNHTDKIGDPLKTAIEAVDTNITAAFTTIYGQTQAEADAGATIVNSIYAPGDARRYGALYDNATDDSAAQQMALDVLAQAGGGTWTIQGGISRAQGLVCRQSDIDIVGDGRLKPVSNASAASIVQFGEDSSNTTLQRVRGHLRVGDTGAVMSTWSNIVGVTFERCTSFDLFIDAPGLGVGIDLAGRGGGVQFNNFYLGSFFNCKVGVRIASQTGGWSNENKFFGGRFSQNSGTWETGVAYIQIIGPAATTNGNVFFSPGFEGVGRCVDFTDAVNNHIVKARWEGGTFSGTENVDFEAVLWRFDDGCARNSLELSHGQDILLSNSKDWGAATRNSDGILVFASVDRTQYFPRGLPINVTVSGVTHTVIVVFSAFASGDTNVYVSRPVITAAPTAVVAPRVSDEGGTVYKLGNLNIQISGTTSATGFYESTEFSAQSMLRTAMVMNAKVTQYPAITYVRGGDQLTGHFFWQVRDPFQTLKASLGDEGELWASEFSMGDVSTPIASRTHVADPSGGGTVDSEARTAINAILATLEAFGFHSSS